MGCLTFCRNTVKTRKVIEFSSWRLLEITMESKHPFFTRIKNENKPFKPLILFIGRFCEHKLSIKINMRIFPDSNRKNHKLNTY